MKWLELRVHPPIIFLICTVLIWYISRNQREFQTEIFFQQKISVILAILAVSIVISAINAFQRAQTTVHPNHPEKTTHLITQGVYRFSRNPMYLALSLLLSALSLWLGNLFGFFVVGGFTIYITQFQINPEERALEENFGQVYIDYKQQTRRWI